MEVDPAQPSTPARSPSVQPLFDFTRPHVAFDSQVLVADRQQKSLTDFLLVRVFNIGTESYEASRETRTRRKDYALARKDSLLYIIGGKSGDIYFDLVESYNHKKNRRGDVPRLNEARACCSALVYNDKLYVTGGYSGVYMPGVEVWNFTGSWKETKPLNYPRADAVLIEFGGRMFAMGGYNEDGYVKEIEIYDDVDDQWSDYGSMRGGRAGFSATVFEKRIYIAGGWSSPEKTPMATMESFDPVSKTWREEPSMSLPRKYLTLATIQKDGTDSHILALGGNAENEDVVQKTEKFEPKWRLLDDQA